MNQDASQQFGKHIRHLRKQRKLSIRGLANKAGIDSGALTRLEHGKVQAPQPHTLTALAAALQVPLADLFAMAGYVIPYDLPSIAPYLNARYSFLPEEARASVNDYLQGLIDEHGLDPEGPAAFEDETNGQH
ncbi:MAG TPA: helix-turn-helix transcriptional regulator [Pseudonocardiaceae bacterium]|jgi:transcriptional regulator with XRE-family HTH domain|nr:helix-turn-helix transcriptional regulator [Pseudonocardiaceae bacterium]